MAKYKVITILKLRLFKYNKIMDIGKRIMIARKAKGYTQKELAKETGDSQGYISLIERNEHTPGMDKLQKIAAALDVKVSDFLV